MQVLYRKYRPTNFDEIIGQEYVVKILRNSVKLGQLSHSYLFVGSRGTGKTSMARILAKAINCLDLQKDGNPCGKCKNCLSIRDGKFPDIVEIDAASNRGIDQVRDLKERIEFSPVMGKYKVYIIDEVHMMTTEAFNALLKTLEEPPKHVIFILATTEPHKLPATILSRCQRHDFKLGTKEDIKVRVQSVLADTGYKLSDSAFDILIKNSGGSYRDVLSLLDAVINGVSDTSVEITEEVMLKSLGVPLVSVVEGFIEVLLFGSKDQAFSYLYEIERDGVNLGQFIKSCLELFRQAFLFKSTKEVTNISDFAKKIANAYSLSELLRLIGLFLEADGEIRSTPIPILIMEMLIMKLPSNKEEPAKDPVLKIVKNKEKKPAKLEEKKRIVVENNDNTTQLQDKESKNNERSNKIIADIQKHWQELKSKIKKDNAHLGAILEGAQVDSEDDGGFNIKVNFAFAKDLLETPKTRQLLSNCMTDICGTSISYRCTVVEPTVKKPRKDPLDMGIVFSKSEDKKVEEKSSEQKKFSNKKIDEMFAGL
jgi:DNA polymerase-3 subunit gamma/tau